MQPEDFLSGETVYKYDQVVTQKDLVMFVQLLEDQYEVMSPKKKEERAHLLTAIKTVDTLLTWLAVGKDSQFRGML